MIERVLTFLNENDLDAILVSSMYNVRYISGFTGDVAFLYISRNRQVLLTDSRYTIWAQKEALDFEIFEVSVQNPHIEKIAEYLHEDNAKTIGFENCHMIYSDVMEFKDKIDFAEFIELDDKLDSLRQVKTELEISKIRSAQAISDDAFTHICKFIKEGMSEEEIALELEMYMRKNGAQRLSFETIVASGVNSAMPHATAGKKLIEYGDFVTMDFGCVFEGYCSDMTRTVVVGKADQRQREIYSVVLAAQKAALAAVSAGKRGCDIDKVARNIIDDAGYSKCFGHGLGHSVGLFIHENPRFSPSEESIIKENMVITVEPGIYIPDFGGVRIEDLIVVKKASCENLTGSPKELIEL